MLIKELNKLPLLTAWSPTKLDALYQCPRYFAARYFKNIKPSIDPFYRRRGEAIHSLLSDINMNINPEPLDQKINKIAVNYKFSSGETEELLGLRTGISKWVKQKNRLLKLNPGIEFIHIEEINVVILLGLCRVPKKRLCLLTC